jgi:hypothetical protein
MDNRINGTAARLLEILLLGIVFGFCLFIILYHSLSLMDACGRICLEGFMMVYDVLFTIWLFNIAMENHHF